LPAPRKPKTAQRTRQGLHENSLNEGVLVEKRNDPLLICWMIIIANNLIDAVGIGNTPESFYITLAAIDLLALIVLIYVYAPYPSKTVRYLSYTYFVYIACHGLGYIGNISDNTEIIYNHYNDLLGVILLIQIFIMGYGHGRRKRSRINIDIPSALDLRVAPSAIYQEGDRERR
jgi:hypothetical protein